MNLDFRWELRYPTEMNKICKSCGISKPLEEFFSNGWYKDTKKYKPSCKQCEQKANMERMYEIIKDFYGEMKCSKCGYSKYIGALECHHRDPTEKDAQISKMRTRSKAAILRELSKCDLLCSNCHREVHSGL